MDSEEYKSMRQCRDFYEEMKENFDHECQTIGHRIRAHALKLFYKMYPSEVEKPSKLKYDTQYRWLNEWVGIRATFDDVMFHLQFFYDDRTDDAIVCREIRITDEMFEFDGPENYAQGWYEKELERLEMLLDRETKLNKATLQGASDNLVKLAIKQAEFDKLKNS